jgi:ubiquinone biosynthesis protein
MSTAAWSEVRRPIDGGGGLAASDRSRRRMAALLLRRFGRVAAIAAHRSARVVWHVGAGRLRPRTIDQAGTIPRQIRLGLEELGPTFVKLGQLLSNRADITPPEVQLELSKLRDHVPRIPHANLVRELERSLGSDSGALFATLEMAPVACGSIAQVHSGTLHSGLRVAVKVRRPGVLADIDADVWVLRRLARLVARLSARARAHDPVAIIDEFAALLRAETNFTTEAANLEAVGRTFAYNDAVTIPRVLSNMSGDSVLVMDWIEGIPLSSRERLEEIGASRAGLARAILQAYGVMIFQSDRFHADPHPGNLIAMKGGRLGLIDFGEVGRVEPAERTALLQMMTAVLGRDGKALGGAVLSVSRTLRTVNLTEFGAQLATLLEPLADASLKDMKLGETLGQLLHVVRTNGIVLPSDLAILIKTMIECESTTNELDPTMSMLDLLGDVGSLAQAPQPTSFETSRRDQSG